MTDSSVAELAASLSLELAQLPRDLRNAAATLGRDEVRFLVDSYYQLQEFRKATTNQSRSLDASEEPHATLDFFSGQFVMLEKQLRGALDSYSAADPLGRWTRQIVGIGPVIAAGLLAHIDITEGKTIGKVWRFAGLDPTIKWERGQKRPYNARLKVLCWKLGDSMVKLSGREDCFYGKLYRQRKEYEVDRDVRGGNADCARETLEARKIRDSATRAIYESGHLPAGRLDLRARRWAVKMFLSHFLEAGHRLKFGEPPPAVYALAHAGHVDYIEPPIPWP